MTNDDVSFHPRTTDLAPRTNRANFTGLVLGCTSYGARPQARAVNLSLTINLAWKIFGNFSKIFQAKLIVRDKLTARAWGRAP